MSSEGRCFCTMARLKAAPKLPGWDSAEDRRNFDARRRRGRLIFLLVLLIFAWIYAPRYCVHEEEDYFDMLTANISGIGRTCDERAEEARLSYVAALFGNETAVPLGSDGGGQAARGCPNEARRVVADMPRLGGELLMDVATDVEEKSYALVEGVLGRTEAEAARRAALVVAGTLLDQAIEGVSAESFRIPISLEPTSFTERFREALLGPFADRRAVKLRLAREKLSAAASFAQEKIEPVASAVLGSHALVETSLAVYNTADDLAFMQTSTNSLFTSTISLQPFETVAELVNNLSDNCLKNQSVPAGSAVLTTQAASKDQGTAKELKFAIRLSYADVGSLALPSPVFVADAPRLEYYATQ